MQALKPLEVLPPASLDHLGFEKDGKIPRIPSLGSLPAPLLQELGIHEGLSHWNGSHALRCPTDRCELTENSRSDSISSPKNSMRAGLRLPGG